MPAQSRPARFGQYLLSKLFRTKKPRRYDELIRRTPADRPCVACEIGVWQGKCSEKLLRARPQLFLYAVDAWQAPAPESTYGQSGDKKAGMDQQLFDDARELAGKRLAPFQDRVRFLQGDSASMADEIADGSLDWAFVDGDHSYEGVLRDMRAFYPKVKPGGFLAGHDWNHPNYPFGVEQAVHEFLAEIGQPRDSLELGADYTWFFPVPG